jgi:hypothetical protein
MKKIFTPFSSATAGNLSSVLRDSGNGKGFLNPDYVYAPSEDTANTPLSGLLADTDQLYINGHCNKGLGYLSTSSACAYGDKVDFDAVVGQLKKLGFPLHSQARVKLWACKGGLDGAQEAPSFAKRFSKEMFQQGYESCRIFAYEEFLMQQYMSGPDNELHKRSATRPAGGASVDEQLLDQFLEDLYDPDLFTEAVLPKRKTWERLVEHAKGETAADRVADAKRSILEGPMKAIWQPKIRATGIVGPRARECRKEFRNGEVVAQAT